MAIPTSYTESELRTYMLGVVSAVANALGWTATDFAEAVNDALSTYGVSDITEATNIAKLRSIAKVEAWRAIAGATVADFQFSADGGSYSRQQMHQQAVAALQRAEAEAVDRGYIDVTAPAITLGAVQHSDPYLTDESLY
ncbi:MAG: hypothetical protein KDE53_13370 [Caldilineaceae bacterium]|nr:hypothetical protein [Caldilineaceae bacterium]